MKSKILIGFFVVFVIGLMLLSNASAAVGPGAWANQATLSNPNIQSQDPENSGMGSIQVVVWEEFNGNNWDIWMKYSLVDGAVGSWVFSPVQPATTIWDEINPAVTVTNADITGVSQIHVVYEYWNQGAGQWDIFHTFTSNLGLVWSVPITLNTLDAHDPAIVYTEDTSNPIPPAVFYGLSVQIVWSELNPVTGFYDILYDAWSYDVPSATWFYAGTAAGPLTIRASVNAPPNTRTCTRPEIASIDDISIVGTWDYHLAVVWEETWSALGIPIQTDIFYRDGTMTVTTGAPPTAAIAFTGLAGQINTNAVGTGNCYDPDIASTQDYVLPVIGLEEFYIHANWIYIDNTGAVLMYHVDTNFAAGPVPAPGAAAFVSPTTAMGPTPIVLDRPTIASRLLTRPPGAPSTIFETWMCWEDNLIAASAPDIWYHVGTYDNGPAVFTYVLGLPIRVPYVPVAQSSEHNPELWNRNDPIRQIGQPFTHLVFDQAIPLGAVPSVVYIDP